MQGIIYATVMISVMLKGLRLDSLRQLFVSPRYHGEDEARTANILTVVLLLLIVVTGLYTIISFLLEAEAGRVANILGFSIAVGLLALLRTGRVRAVQILFSLIIWFGAVIGGIFYNGFAANGPSPFIAVLLIHGVILRGREQLVAFAATLIAVLALFTLQSNSLLPPPRTGIINFNPVVSSIFLLCLTALVLYFVTRNLGEALNRARSNEDATRALLDDLVHTTISRTYLDNILSSLSDTLIVLGKEGEIERINPATLKLLGYSGADLIGQHADKILTPNALEWVDKTSAQAVMSVETSYIASDGREIPVLFSSAILYADDLSNQGIVCVAQDITERQRAAQQLRQREELYRTLARSLPRMGVILYDHDGRIMIAEGEVLADVGYESTVVEGQAISIIDPLIANADIETLSQQALKGKQIRLESQTGDKTLEIELLPVHNEAGETFAGLMLLNNVTNTKIIETELMSRIEQLTTLRQVDAELSRSLDSGVVLDMALDPLMHVAGAQSAAIFVYQDSLKLAKSLGDHPADDLQAEIQQVMRENNAINGGNFLVIPLSSMQRPIGAVVLGREGNFDDAIFSFVQILAARIAVALDNAQLYEMSVAQLNESQQLYERVSQLEQVKTDMIRIAAHDLRNPLNIVSGFTELLLDNDEVPEHERSQLEHIFRASQRMQNMVADILSLDRIERLQEGGYEKAVNLSSLIETTYKAHEVKAEQHEYRLQVPEAPVHVRGDEPQLREAISNLVGNAIKYTPTGGTVTVSLQCNENTAVFEVIDTGYGIPEDAQARLFEPFYRVKDKETRQIEGTGLGLHLVKNIIERHNGQMFVKSVHGEGSTFGFRLDIAADSEDESDTTEVMAT